MGWDMNAATKSGSEKLTAEQLAAFKTAAEQVLADAGSVDCLLEAGGLDCSVCARAMEAMTDLSAWTDWTPEQMGEAFAGAVLPDDLTDDNRWEYHSAYHFMRVCALLGLGAHASY